MKCPETNEMAAYLDGALTHAERILWDDHFRQCLKCRKDLEELRMLLILEPLDPGGECLAKGMSLVDGAHPGQTNTGTFRFDVHGIRN
ncbi:MAG: anti-sigma factor family protein [Acidobacteriota bacterium]